MRIRFVSIPIIGACAALLLTACVSITVPTPESTGAAPTPAASPKSSAKEFDFSGCPDLRIAMGEFFENVSQAGSSSEAWAAQLKVLANGVSDAAAEAGDTEIRKALVGFSLGSSEYGEVLGSGLATDTDFLAWKIILNDVTTACSMKPYKFETGS